MSSSFVAAVNERTRDAQKAIDNVTQKAIDNVKYEKIAKSMVINGDADVMARVLRKLAEEDKVVLDGPLVTIGNHTFIPCG